MERGDHENSTLAFLTEESTISPKDDLREKIKIEFYKTYDVMTGIRIAATLGGFFSMMILLVLYKNYCKPSKTLSEEQLNAAVTAAAEEEDRALQAALEATSFYSSLGKHRESLENPNQVLLSPRFSSIGGGYSHLTPPVKMTVLQQRGESLPGSVAQFGTNTSPFSRNGKVNRLTKEDFEFDIHTSDYFTRRNHPADYGSRRVSCVTCSSADSAYLERRCSAFEMGLPGPPHFVRQSREKLLGKKEEPWDFYFPIDIQVIQPTPEMSPTASERNLYEEQTDCGLLAPGFHDHMHRLSVNSCDIGLAPLASISSLGSFSSQSSSPTSKSLNAATNNSSENNHACTCPDDSVGSDSVFMDDMDMEDDVEEFATDSEFEYDGFDDDYSFCESKTRSGSRTEIPTLKFASFDSYDASISQDSASENIEDEIPDTTQQSEVKPPVQSFSRQHITDLKRHPSLYEGNKMRRKLVKTYSEPRNSKLLKHLPPWLERGRSGYVPKRQMSSPSAKKKNVIDNSIEHKLEVNEKDLNFERKTSDTPKCKPSQDNENAKDLTKYLLPTSSNVSSSISVTVNTDTQKSDDISTSTPKQGFSKDLPLKSTHQLSLSNTQEKRSRLQKQKNFIEDVKPTHQSNEKTEAQQLTGNTESNNFPVNPENLLKPINITLGSSCERLDKVKICKNIDEKVSKVQVSLNTSKGNQALDNSFQSTSSQDPASK